MPRKSIKELSYADKEKISKALKSNDYWKRFAERLKINKTAIDQLRSEKLWNFLVTRDFPLLDIAKALVDIRFVPLVIQVFKEKLEADWQIVEKYIQTHQDDWREEDNAKPRPSLPRSISTSTTAEASNPNASSQRGSRGQSHPEVASYNSSNDPKQQQLVAQLEDALFPLPRLEPCNEIIQTKSAQLLEDNDSKITFIYQNNFVKKRIHDMHLPLCGVADWADGLRIIWSDYHSTLFERLHSSPNQSYSASPPLLLEEKMCLLLQVLLNLAFLHKVHLWMDDEHCYIVEKFLDDDKRYTFHGDLQSTNIVLDEYNRIFLRGWKTSLAQVPQKADMDNFAVLLVETLLTIHPDEVKKRLTEMKAQTSLPSAKAFAGILPETILVGEGIWKVAASVYDNPHLAPHQTLLKWMRWLNGFSLWSQALQ